MTVRRYDIVKNDEHLAHVTLWTEDGTTYYINEYYVDYFDNMYGDSIPFWNNRDWELENYSQALAKFEIEKEYLRTSYEY